MSDLLQLVRGCTFDDFLFNPQYSVIERRDPAAIDLSCQLSTQPATARPIVSANMDTITRSEMAIAIAEEGGIGIIDRGFRSGDIEPQVREVERVKRRQHGIIADPYTIRPNAPLTEAASVMQRTGVGTLVVVDENRRIVGLLTTRDLRFADRSKTVSERMTPRDRLVVREGPIDVAAAEEVMREHKIKKLPLVDAAGPADGTRHREGSDQAGAAPLRDARRSRTATSRRGDRRQRRLPRTRGGTAQARAPTSS